MATHRRTITMGGVAAALVIAALAFPRSPSAPGDDELVPGSQPAQGQVAELNAPKPRPAARRATRMAASATVPTHTVSAPSTKTPEPKSEKTRLAESGAISAKEDAANKPSGSEAIRPAAASVASSTGAMPITITGCLETSVDHDEFRLTDIDGVDAPRSRSWRTGFLTKRSAPVALVEPPARLALGTHVGRRITATGLLTSHDLKVSALRAVGPPCS